MYFSGKHISNNNQSAVKILAKACRRYSRERNRILAGAAALGIIVLCSVFSIAYGKIEAGYLQGVRSYGTTATTYLERGTMEQYHAIQELDYIKDVGRRTLVGFAYQEGQAVSSLEIVDTVAWEKMRMPAYTHIHGDYPREEGEVMLASRALKALGVTRPREGMKLPLTADLEIGQEEAVNFTLCGWYTDYVDPVILPSGYISGGQAEKWGKSLEEPDELLICQKDTIDEYRIEERLYEDIPMRDQTQRFVGGNSFLYSEVNDFVGGFGMAAFCVVLVLVGVFFLIHNIFEISMYKEIRQIGLLDTLGTTPRQICGIYLRETAYTICWGIVFGVAGAMAIVLFLVPKALGSLYLFNYGKAEDLLVFRLELFAASVLFTAVVVFIAAAHIIYRAARLDPLEALRYIGTSKHRRRRKGRGMLLESRHNTGVPGRAARKARFLFRKPIFYMAWQNLFRYRKRCFLTILSLFLGVVTALGAVVLSRGTDVTHSIEKRPDFIIGGNSLGWETPEMTAKNGLGEDEKLTTQHDDFAPITTETKERLLSVQGVMKEDAVIVEGAYMYVDVLADSMRPWEKAMGSLQEVPADEEPSDAGEGNRLPSSWGETRIQVIDDALIRKLGKYVEQNQLSVDMESLRDGTGAVFLHYHAFSPEMQQEADKTAGMPLTFWRLPSRKDRTVSWEQMDDAGFESWRQKNCQITRMKMAGYLDTQAKGFPSFRRESNGAVRYFIVSEKGFQKLETGKKTFSMEINVKKDYEPAAKAAIRKILQEENHRDICLGLYVNCKSDELADAQEYIRVNRIILMALSLTLILMGILNYLNVMATGIFSRQRELAVMECVGMTGKQIKGMLAAEGGIYCVIVGFLTLTVGSGILRLIRMYMESRIAYFKFLYPVAVAGSILAAVSVVCVVIPLVMYGRMEKRSMTRRAAEE